MATSTHYMMAVGQVLQKSEAKRRGVRTLGRTVRLAGGIPFKFLGRPISGPQCVTVSLVIDDLDWDTVSRLGDRFAMRAGSHFARVYRDLAAVRVEFTLPSAQWREVRLQNLPSHKGTITVGQRALGPVARLDMDNNPHKAIFGSTRTGKTSLEAAIIVSLARTHSPEELQFLIINPKNDPAFYPFERLAHLAAPVATGYDTAVEMLRLALREMEERRQNRSLQRVRLMVMIDEVAQLTEIRPEAGPMITQLSQLAGGLGFNLIVASQAANPSTFGEKGSLAQANFLSRISLQLPDDQAYMALRVKGQHTGQLGSPDGTGKGDALATNGGPVVRFRGALVQEVDYEALPRRESAPALPEQAELAGDQVIRSGEWSKMVDPDHLAYALTVRDSATAIQKQFGGSMDRARLVRDYALKLRERADYWIKVKKGAGG